VFPIAAGRGHMPPGASREGAQKGRCIIFLQHEIYKNSMSRDGHGSTNHVHRTTHVLVSSVALLSRSSKCTKIAGGWGLAPDPTGSLHRSPGPLAGFKRAYF